MARITRAALAFGFSVVAIASSATTARAEGAEPRSVAPEATPMAQLQVAHSGKCLDIDRAKTENGVRAQQWTCNGSQAQLWYVLSKDDSTFVLMSGSSRKCLEVENSGTQNGAAVQQWECTSGKQMRWQMVLVDHTRKLFQLRPVHTEDRCLDIDRSSMQNGAKVQLWRCNQTEAQLWRIQLVS
ncbi:RICIN domain-containing protein [Streptomyces netropsis]|uniref:Ricin B lectin domain-containing protein n=1 Tax=Streptomyces netropsis TaxID=55404 RepID=A0A7W7L7D6_STRNE|nr:RICIN domain-containing protein [Streptomyces netropsis]MBB4884381.1 hypothetical protein [Streptomyces netropsis]GGR04095.1 hypothetical protein GCM10010219_05330 [Streptomyces netropsis]